MGKDTKLFEYSNVLLCSIRQNHTDEGGSNQGGEWSIEKDVAYVRLFDAC